MHIFVALVNADQVQLTELELADGSRVEDALKAAGVTPSQKHTLAV